MPPQNDQVDDAADQTGSLAPQMRRPAIMSLTRWRDPCDGNTHGHAGKRSLSKIAEQKRACQNCIWPVPWCFCRATAIWYFWPRPDEHEIDWPKDAQGNYQDAFASAPGGGREAGGYDVMYPGNGTFVITPTDLGFICQGRVGRDMNIPVRIILGEENDVSFIKLG